MLCSTCCFVGGIVVRRWRSKKLVLGTLPPPPKEGNIWCITFGVCVCVFNSLYLFSEVGFGGCWSATVLRWHLLSPKEKGQKTKKQSVNQSANLPLFSRLSVSKTQETKTKAKANCYQSATFLWYLSQKQSVNLQKILWKKETKILQDIIITLL